MSIELLPAVSDFLARSPLGHFINNGFTSAGDRGDVINPAQGTVLARIAYGGPKEVDAAVEAADAAFPAWAELSPNQRAVILHRAADKLEQHTEELAQLESLDVGKAITAARAFDIPFGIECIRYFADFSVNAQYGYPLAVKNMEARVHRAPYGVCGFIFPWNFPFDLLMWGTAPALAAGNTVVVKPSEVTPLTTLYVAELIRDILPAGVFNIVLGDGPGVGKPLTDHRLMRRMSFTGSPEVGRLVGEVCGRRLVPCKLELGGKGAAVVFDDVDIAATAEQLAGAITLNTGQVCCTATRWIVQENIYDELAAAAAKVLSETKIGPGLDEETQMGPVVSRVQQERVLSYFEKGLAEGATAVLEGGEGEGDGFFVKPYLLEGEPDNVCFREEIFGPAAFLTKFKDADDAIEQIHLVDYGLANSVWSKDLDQAHRVADSMVVGNSWINAHNVFAYGLPYGGVNRSGIGGGVNSPATFYDYLRDKTVARPL